MNNSTSEGYIIQHAILPVLSLVCLFCSCIGIYCYKDREKDIKYKPIKKNGFENTAITEL